MSSFQHLAGKRIGLLAVMGLLILPSTGSAVIVEQGTIETNGTITTADRFYFDVLIGGAIEISVVDLTNPVKIARPSLRIYEDDGVLDAADLIASADAAMAGAAAVLNFAIAAGSYLAMVSEFDLPAGGFGPRNPFAANPISYDYEIGFSDTAANDTQVTCIKEGLLGGGFASTERVPSGCVGVGEVAVPAPSGLALFGTALALAFGLRGRSRAG